MTLIQKLQMTWQKRCKKELFSFKIDLAKFFFLLSYHNSFDQQDVPTFDEATADLQLHGVQQQRQQFYFVDHGKK
jgi:hypothetical protein